MHPGTSLWKVDLHTHTHHSKDSLTSFGAYIAACLRKGIRAVAVTDHNAIDGAFVLRELAPFPVIVGEEIKTVEGEIIGLFLERWIPPDLTPEETISRIREQGGLVYIPHPGDRLRSSVLKRQALKRIADDIDIVEVFNARVTLPGDNESARTFAQEWGLLQGAGSDAHTTYEIGQAHVIMEPFSTREEFLDSLGRGQVVGRLSSPLIHFASMYARIRKRLLR